MLGLCLNRARSGRARAAPVTAARSRSRLVRSGSGRRSAVIPRRGRSDSGAGSSRQAHSVRGSRAGARLPQRLPRPGGPDGGLCSRDAYGLTLPPLGAAHKTAIAHVLPDLSSLLQRSGGSSQLSQGNFNASQHGGYRARGFCRPGGTANRGRSLDEIAAAIVELVVGRSVDWPDRGAHRHERRSRARSAPCSRACTSRGSAPHPARPSSVPVH